MQSVSRTKRSWLFYAFISPWLVGFLAFTFLPMLFSLYTAFTDWDGLTLPRFVGLANFREMFTLDDLFIRSMINTFYYVLVSVPLGLLTALGLAMLVKRRLPGSYLFRAVFYLPSVVSGVALYIVWRWLYDPQIGLFNYLLSFVGITGPEWLNDPAWAMPAIILMSLSFVGGAMLIFLAGLLDIPEELNDAARIDGATSVQAFWNVTLPLLTPVIFFNLITGLIGAFQIFAQPYTMTRGGPLDATYVTSIHIYNTAFRSYDFGYASALAWALFLVILVFSLLVLASSRKWVHYK